jgi:dihydrofolate reductase
MSKVVMFNLISLDGYFEGLNKWDLAWHQVDNEFNLFAIDQLDHASGLIFGRVTYQGMANYWSTSEAMNDDPEVARRMNSIPKYVFSKSLDKADWHNTQLIKADAAKELIKIKQQASQDLLIFGSAQLSSTFSQQHLIDEYRLMVNPVVLGKGNHLFAENGNNLKFRLLGSRVFKNGNVLLTYQPAVNT